MSDARTRADGPRITVYHATSPTCSWSWGYEAVLNRLRLVYGDQVRLHLVWSSPYDDWSEWKRHYGMGWDEAMAWMAEGAATMDVPLGMAGWTEEAWPKDVTPALLATMAARRQDARRAERFARELNRLVNVEAKDPTTPEAFEAAARAAGLDAARLRRDLADEAGLRREVEEQTRGVPHLPLGFYNLAVTDGNGRKVVLDHAFEPEEVERAVDYLARHTLTKRRPTDVVGYLREHGLAPASEVRRVFGLTREAAAETLAALVAKGEVRAVGLAGAPHYDALVEAEGLRVRGGFLTSTKGRMA